MEETLGPGNILKEDTLSSTISAISLTIALVGVSLNALLTRPFVGIAYYAGKDDNPSELPGKIANVLIVAGTFGQFISAMILIA
jgi:hypothetical protein